jgi:hypothetical protein
MKQLKFSNIPEDRKHDMNSLLRLWRRSGKSLEVLVETLQQLSKENRPPAHLMLNYGDPAVASLYCTYGKGANPRIIVTREDAAFLLEVVTDLSKCFSRNLDREEMLGSAIEKVADIVFEGKVPAINTIADDVYGPVITVLSKFDISIKQQLLF